MADNEVKIKFTGEDNVSKTIDGISGSLKDQGNQAKKTAASIELTAEGFRKVADDAKKTAAQITAFFKNATSASAEYDRTIFGIEQGLKNAGNAAGVSKNEIIAFADELGDATLTSEEATLKASRALLSFQTIQGDTFFRALTVTQDLSESMGTDLQGNIIQVAKALEDPVKGLSALARSGTQFTAEQQNLIKGLVESGKQLEAQNEILNVLEQQYGGVGVAAAQGLAGAQDTLGENINDLTRAFGDELVPAFTAVTNAAANLINAFLDAPESLQKLVILSTAFTGALSAAVTVIFAYNAAMATKTALELKSAASAAANKLVTLGVAGATKKATEATLGYIKTLAPLALKLVAVGLAVEAVTSALDKYGASDFSEQSKQLRDAATEFNEGISKGAKGVEKEIIEPYEGVADKVGNVFRKVAKIAADPFVTPIKPLINEERIFGSTRVEARIEQSRIALGEFTDDVNRNIDALNANGNATENTAEKQKFYEASLQATKDAIANLDEQQLGTEAYNEQKAALEVQIALLEKNANAWGVLTAEQKNQQKQDQAAAIKAENIELEKQADLLEKQRAKEKETTAESRAEEQIKLARKIEDDKSARQEENQKLLNDRQIEFEATKAAAQTEFQESQQSELDKRELERLALQRATEDADRAEAKAFDKELNDQKAVFDKSERGKTKTFTAEIESIKKQASDERLLAEKKLADEIAQRQSAQSAGFSQAARIAGEQAQLLALETEEERQQLIKDFEAQRRVEANVAALELADKTLNAKGILKLAAEVANVGTVKTEEDAKKVQEAIALIQEQQQKQQAEADKKAEEELRLKIAADEEALQLKLQTAAETFELAQEARKLAFEDELAAKREERELALIERGRIRQDEDRLNQEIFDAARESKQLEFQAQLDNAQKEFDAQQAKIQKDFADSEQADQRAFEDEQRAKEKSFNESERRKDEESARRIAAIRSRITSPATGEDIGLDIEGALADGGAVVAGKTYLVGENNPEPLVFNNGKMAMVGQGGAQLITPTQSGYVYPNLAALPTGDVVSEIKALRNDIQNTPRSFGASTYNIVGAQDPVRAAIKLQQERIKQRARMARI